MEIKITGNSEEFAVLLMTLMDKEKNSPEGEYVEAKKNQLPIPVERYELLLNEVRRNK